MGNPVMCVVEVLVTEWQPGRDAELAKAITRYLNDAGRTVEVELWLSEGRRPTEGLVPAEGEALRVEFQAAYPDAESARPEAAALAAYIQEINGAPCIVLVDVYPCDHDLDWGGPFGSFGARRCGT